MEKGFVDTAGEGEAGVNCEGSTDICTPPRVKHTVSGKLLQRIGSLAPCSVMT